MWVHTPEKVGRDAGELAGIAPLGVAATSDVDALIGLQPDCVVYAASGPERGAGAVPDYERLLAAGINVVTTTSTELVYPPVADAALRERLTQGGRGRRCIALRVGDLPRLRVRRAGTAAHHAVPEHPDPPAHRGLAERPLPGRRRDDGRAGLRPPAGLRALHRPARRHPDGVAGADRAHRPRTRRRARRDPRSGRARAHRPRHRGRVRHGPRGNRRCGPHRSRAGSSTVGRRSSSTTSSAWRATSPRTGRRRTTTPPTSSASRAIPTSSAG